MLRVRFLLLAIYLGAFVAVTIVWVVARLRQPANFALPHFGPSAPSAPGWVVVWGRHAMQIRLWSAPIPTTQATDPGVRQAAPNSSGYSGRGDSTPAGLYAHASGYYWNGGTAYAFREIGFHYHVLWWLTAPAPVLAAIAHRRRRRRRRMRMATMRCVECGYDLRATPDRCPECGKAVE